MTIKTSYFIVDNRVDKGDIRIYKTYKDITGFEIENVSKQELVFEIHVTDGKMTKLVVK